MSCWPLLLLDPPVKGPLAAAEADLAAFLLLFLPMVATRRDVMDLPPMPLAVLVTAAGIRGIFATTLERSPYLQIKLVCLHTPNSAHQKTIMQTKMGPFAINDHRKRNREGFVDLRTWLVAAICRSEPI